MAKLDTYSTESYVAEQVRRLADDRIVNVWDFRSAKPSGVMCDGTDDYPAFVAARDSVASGQAIRIYVPRGTYLLNTSVTDNGRLVTVEQDPGVTITGSGVIFVTTSIQNASPRIVTQRRGTPGGGFNVLGEGWNHTNTSASTVGYGQRYNYTHAGTPTSGYDVAYGMVAAWTGLATGAQALAHWEIYHSPNNGTWNGGLVWAEINPVNRGPDMGWIYKPGALTRWIGGIRFVPEQSDVTGDGGSGRHVTFAYTMARSGVVNIDGVYVRTYNGYLVEPDAIAPNGYGIFINGNEILSDRYTAIGANLALKAGVDFTAASFDNNEAIKLDVLDKISWFSSSTERAYITGQNGYLALHPGATGYISAAIPDNTATGGNARSSQSVDLQLGRSAATQVASGSYSTIVGGLNNTASGTGGSVVGGLSNTASGVFSLATGKAANTRGQQGKRAHSAGEFALSGDAQEAVNLVRRTTTDGTTTPLTADNSTVSSISAISLPNNSAFAFRGEVVARSSTGDTAMWTVVGLIKRGANAASTALVGSPTVTKVFNDAGAAAWTLAVSAETTVGSLQLDATGAAATTIRWVGKVETVEVSQ